MEILVLLLLGASALIGLGSLACWIMVVVTAFQNNDTLMGILSIVLCGLGAFIIGWIKSGEWGIQNLMLIWSGLIVASIVIQVIAAVLAPAVGG